MLDRSFSLCNDCNVRRNICVIQSLFEDHFASYLPVICLWLDTSVYMKCTFFSPQDFSMPSAIRLPASASMSSIAIFCNKNDACVNEIDLDNI